MSWRDGHEPRPSVAAGAETVLFDFAAADAMGQRLHDLRQALEADRAARDEADAILDGWVGPHRMTYDTRRAAHEGVLTADDVGRELKRLRTAWDEAARAQRRANAVAPTPASGPHRRPSGAVAPPPLPGRRP